MKIALGSDHRGMEQRSWAQAEIEFQGHEASDFGTHSTESCDYPDIAKDVALAVAQGDCERGILICGTGIGMSIAANKIDGIRAAVCHDLNTAVLSRQHNDANILCLPGNDLDERQLKSIVHAWIDEPFEGGRHQRRVEKIAEIRQNC
ncbi:MAG: ribose 5-phosphate isomerase B [Pirellulaceae bacterium]